MKYRRNGLCYCDSGKKYKKCHLYKNEGWTDTIKGWINSSIITTRLIEIEAEKQKNKT